MVKSTGTWRSENGS